MWLAPRPRHSGLTQEGALGPAGRVQIGPSAQVTGITGYACSPESMLQLAPHTHQAELCVPATPWLCTAQRQPCYGTVT